MLHNAFKGLISSPDLVKGKHKHDIITSSDGSGSKGGSNCGSHRVGSGCRYFDSDTSRMCLRPFLKVLLPSPRVQACLWLNHDAQSLIRLLLLQVPMTHLACLQALSMSLCMDGPVLPAYFKS